MLFSIIHSCVFKLHTDKSVVYTHTCTYMYMYIHVHIRAHTIVYATLRSVSTYVYVYLFTGMKLSILVYVFIGHTSVHFSNIVDSTVTDVLDTQTNSIRTDPPHKASFHSTRSMFAPQATGRSYMLSSSLIPRLSPRSVVLTFKPCVCEFKGQYYATRGESRNEASSLPLTLLCALAAKYSIPVL